MSLDKRDSLSNQPVQTDISHHPRVLGAKRNNDELVSCILKGVVAVKRLKQTDESQAADLFYKLLSLIEGERLYLMSLRNDLYQLYLPFWNEEYEFLGSFGHSINPIGRSDYEKLISFKTDARASLGKIISSFEQEESMKELLGKLTTGNEQLKSLFAPLWTLESCTRPNVIELIQITTEHINELFGFSINDFSILAGLGTVTECLYQNYSSLNLINVMRH